MFRLYYAPGTCAPATHIVLEEAGAPYVTLGQIQQFFLCMWEPALGRNPTEPIREFPVMLPGFL